MKRSVFFLFAGLLIFFAAGATAQNLAWSPTQGPYATGVNTFDTLGNSIFAGTNTGLYISSNGGSLWTLVPSVTGIVNDIATSGITIYAGGSAGVTLSSDGGTTWVVRDSGFPLFPLVYALKNVNDTLYACLGGSGFYRSTDGGKFWALPSPDARDKSIFTMIGTGTSLIFAEGAGILRSTDNGFSWNEPDGIISEQTIHVFAMKDKTIYAGTEAGVFISADDGATWNPLGTGMQVNDVVVAFTISADKKTFFAGTKNTTNERGIYRSNDGGNTWQLMNTGLSSLSINSLFTNGAQILAGTVLGISSNNSIGDSWQTASDGLPKPSVISLGSIYDQVFAGTAGFYLFSSVDTGSHWMQHITGLTRKNVNAFFFDGTTILAGTDAITKQGFGGMHRSTDNGSTWTQDNTGMPLMSISSITSYNNKLYSCGDSGLFSSSNNGNSWDSTNSQSQKSLYADYFELYTATNSGLWKFTDNAGWETIGFPNTINIHGITVNGKYLYAGTDSGVYRDSLSVWKLVTGDTLGVQCLYSNGSIVCAGTKTGMYVSSDDGITWLFQQSAGPVPVNCIYGYNKVIYAGTTAGVIKASLIGFGVKQSANINPLSLSVTNPSTDHAIIRYTIEQRGSTSIAAFDLLGRKYSQILNEQLDPGDYNREWNTSSIPSGTYLLRLISDGNQASTMINVIH